MATINKTTGAKESKNNVTIIGTLLTNKLATGSYKDKTTGTDVEYISGSVVVRVNQFINGVEEIEEVPVNVWSSKYLSSGKINPSYENLSKAANFVSLAVADNESLATKIMIKGARLEENIFSPDSTQVFCTPRISTGFINSTLAGGNYNPEATFIVDMVVGNIVDETNSEGISTGRLKIKGMVSRYDGTMNNFDFYAENPNAINYIRSYWQVGETVQVSGKIRYTSKTIEVQVPTRFGDPVIQSKTTTTKELIITADSTDALGQQEKFTEAEISKGQEARNLLIEKEKARAASVSKSNASSTNGNTNSNPYGF